MNIIYNLGYFIESPTHSSNPNYLDTFKSFVNGYIAPIVVVADQDGIWKLQMN